MMPPLQSDESFDVHLRHVFTLACERVTETKSVEDADVLVDVYYEVLGELAGGAVHVSMDDANGDCDDAMLAHDAADAQARGDHAGAAIARMLGAIGREGRMRIMDGSLRPRG